MCTAKSTTTTQSPRLYRARAQKALKVVKLCCAAAVAMKSRHSVLHQITYVCIATAAAANERRRGYPSRHRLAVPSGHQNSLLVRILFVRPLCFFGRPVPRLFPLNNINNIDAERRGIRPHRALGTALPNFGFDFGSTSAPFSTLAAFYTTSEYRSSTLLEEKYFRINFIFYVPRSLRTSETLLCNGWAAGLAQVLLSSSQTTLTYF